MDMTNEKKENAVNNENNKLKLEQFVQNTQEKNALKTTTTEENLKLIMDVNLNVRVELGRCKLPIKEVIALTKGSIVELDKLAGDMADIYVNDKLVARGEILILNDNFCVRVKEIVTPKEQKT